MSTLSHPSGRQDQEESARPHCCRTMVVSRKRSFQPMQWLLPGSLLLLMPKCPLCLAGYFALFTGLSLSIPAATFVSTSLIVLSGIWLVYLLARQLRFKH